MKFWTILSGADQALTAVLLEQDAGGLVGVGIDEAATKGARDAISLVMSLPKLRLQQAVGAQVSQVEVGPGDAGYAEAVIYTIRPPLCPGPFGTISKIGPPGDMLRRVWRVSSGGAEMPDTISFRVRF